MDRDSLYLKADEELNEMSNEIPNDHLPDRESIRRVSRKILVRYFQSNFRLQWQLFEESFGKSQIAINSKKPTNSEIGHLCSRSLLKFLWKSIKASWKLIVSDTERSSEDLEDSFGDPGFGRISSIQINSAEFSEETSLLNPIAY